MTRARNIANPTQITIPLDVSANITSNASISVGNTEVNSFITDTTIAIGNSSVNTIIHSTGITANGANIHSVNAASVGGNTASDLRSYSDTAYSNAVSSAAATYLPLNGGSVSGTLFLTSNNTQIEINRADGVGSDWRIYGWASGLNIFPVVNSSTVFFGRDGQATDVNCYNGNFYAPAFYDTNNSGYYVDPNGSTNLNSLFVRAGSAYAAVTNLGYTAPIQIAETSTGTTATRWIPMISQTSVSSNGYRQHTVFGSVRGNVWGDAFIAVGGNDAYPTNAFTFNYGGTFTAPGTKNFRINHPLEEKANTHYLVHTAIEAPQADLIYRGKVNLENGTAEVNIDQVSRMSNGTFEILTKNIQVFTTNESDWVNVRGSVSNNILTIEAQDPSSNALVSWIVIAERDDPNMYITNKDGRIEVEPLKEPLPQANTN